MDVEQNFLNKVVVKTKEGKGVAMNQKKKQFLQKKLQIYVDNLCKEFAYPNKIKVMLKYGNYDEYGQAISRRQFAIFSSVANEDKVFLKRYTTKKEPDTMLLMIKEMRKNNQNIAATIIHEFVHFLCFVNHPKADDHSTTFYKELRRLVKLKFGATVSWLSFI